MSHVGKRPKERRGEEEESLATTRRRLSPGGGPLGLQLAWGNACLGLRDNGCER